MDACRNADQSALTPAGASYDIKFRLCDRVRILGNAGAFGLPAGVRHMIYAGGGSSVSAIVPADRIFRAHSLHTR